MPPKLYVDAPPNGDFRAMPARGDGLAILKWVTSFPGNPARGLPVVTGALLVSNAETGELVAILDCAAVTSLRTGAAAAVSALALAREDAATAGIVGCGVNGALGRPLPGGRRLRARASAPTPPRGGRRRSPPSSAGARATRRGGARLRRRRHRHARRRAGRRRRRPRPGQHLAVLGADGARQGGGRRRGDRALRALLRRVGAGLARAASWPARSRPGSSTREDVTELGAVLAGDAAGAPRTTRSRSSTRPDSRSRTSGSRSPSLEAWREGRVEATEISL